MRLVERTARISVAEVVTVVGRPASGEVSYLLDGRPCRVVRDGQGRAWFACECGRRSKHLYVGEQLECRICAGPLHYASEYYPSRALPLAGRITRLRRSIKADPRVFARIAWRPRARHRVHFIIKEIWALEAELLKQMSSWKPR